jgi:rod shape-determining protein MreB and related proteins
VRELLLHLLRLAGIETQNRNGKKIRAVIGVPAEALRVNKQQVRKAMAGVVDNLMIISEPFAVAYGLEALLHSLIIDIGAGTADFCVMKGRLPTEEEQRTLTQAGDWVDQQLFRVLREKHPEAAISLHMVRDWKEAHSFVGEPKSPVVVKVPVAGRPTEIDITEPMRQACEALVPPLVEAMTDLLARVEPEFQEKVRQNVILSGGTGLIDGLGQRLQKELQEFGGGRVRVVKDPVFCGSDGGLALALDASDSDWEKLAAG